MFFFLGGFGRFLREQPRPAAITGLILNQDPRIDQKKLVPKIAQKLTPTATLSTFSNSATLRVFVGKNVFLRFTSHQVVEIDSEGYVRS